MKNLRVLLVLVFFLMAFVLMSSQSWALVWDFKGDAKDWKPATGEWSVKDGEYIQSLRGVSAVRTFIGDNNWTDYTVETKIKITENSYAGLIFRAQSELEYHVFYINVIGGACEWWHHTKPNPDSRVQHFNQPTAKVKIELNKQYTLKVIAKGQDFSFYIDDIEQKVDKTDIYPSGKIGLWAWDTKASFDDVKISGKGIPESAAISLNGKLPSIWARIKSE
jgi:hypothetical protein